MREGYLGRGLPVVDTRDEKVVAMNLPLAKVLRKVDLVVRSLISRGLDLELIKVRLLENRVVGEELDLIPVRPVKVLLIHGEFHGGRGPKSEDIRDSPPLSKLVLYVADSSEDLRDFCELCLVQGGGGKSVLREISA